jgi:hypothetical protein
MDTRTLSYQGIGCQIQIMGTGYLDAKSAPDKKETGSMISQVFLAFNYSSFVGRYKIIDTSIHLIIAFTFIV